MSEPLPTGRRRHDGIVRKAVVPAAGLGTRFLPATKATPKEMLPVVDKPAIQYVVEEAVSAGIDDVLIILGRNKNNISNHFDSVPELESNLSKKGDHEKLKRVQDSSEMADIHFVRQGEPKGLGHAVLRARSHVGDSTFAVLLGDDLIDARDVLLEKMLEQNKKTGLTVVALMEVSPDQIHMYGAAAVEATDEEDVVKVTGLVEKPKKEDAPSNYAIIGRYVLTPGVFDVLERERGVLLVPQVLVQPLPAPGCGDGHRGVVAAGRMSGGYSHCGVRRRADRAFVEAAATGRLAPRGHRVLHVRDPASGRVRRRASQRDGNGHPQ